ncbi:MAG TPA: protein kinase, partial [Pyrinomonadaceae bacterium]|nr:protein kinase [Pyrinomonadaceae bacterium]
MAIETGTRVGKYEIKELLGTGGMGEVYRALDTELRRAVALKFLPADIAADPRRMRRFEQEALAASALNHPNILTVYDISQTEEGRRFFSTELVEGVTLREHLSSRPVKLGEVLDIAVQIASALVAAHAAGVVHRDIKPDNVMVRRDGYIKVLDFGLAKISGRPTDSADSEADTRALVVTDAGAVMGTVSYMSPEQTAGGEVDARTDIWSTGVVLYEMLTGHVPFRGKSASHTIVAILDEEPPPLSMYLPEAPESLQDIVSDALTKDRDARLQTAKQLLAKLQRIKRRLDTGGSLDHTLTPEASSGDGAAHSGPVLTRTVGGVQRTTARSGDFLRVPTSPDAEHKTARVARSRRKLALAAAAVVLAGLAFGGYKLLWRGGASSGAPFAPLGSMKFAKVPASAATVSASISPDGRYVARVVFEAGRVSLRLRQLGTTSERDLVPADETNNFVGTPSFSPDGNYVYFTSGKRGQVFRELYRVALNGGEPQKVAYDVDSGAAVSPDGKRVAFRRHMPKEREDTLVMIGVDGGGEQTVAKYKLPQRIDAPTWSPDGSVVAYTVNGTDDEGYYVNIEALVVADKSVRKVSTARWRLMANVAWLADSTGLVVAARDRASLPSTPMQLWYVAYPSGEAERITNDLNNFVGVSLTADARTLLAKQGRDTSNLWIAPAGDSSRARQLTNGGGNGFGNVSWLADGRLVYDSDASGNVDVWVMSADGTGARQLTQDQNTDTSPVATPDGRYIVFKSNRAVGWGIWRMNPDGGNAKELVSNVDQTPSLQVSPDSQWVYYVSRDEEGRGALWRVSVEGGAPAKVLSDKIGYVRLAPDGKSIFSIYLDPVPDATAKIYVFPLEGGTPTRVLEAPTDMYDAREWSPDGQAIDYVSAREGVANLWRLPLAGGKARQLTDWKTDYI